MQKNPLKNEAYWIFALCYAFRNLGRNRRRTTLTVTTVLFAVAMTIIANRYSTAIIKLWSDGTADTGSAHAQLHAIGYGEKSEGVQESLTLVEDQSFETTIRKDPDVSASVRRLNLEGILSAGDESVYFIGKGVEPAAEMAVSPLLFTENDEGAFVSESNPAGVTVGKGLAASLGLKIGDEVTLITQTVQGSVNGIDAKVIGVVDAAIPSFSQRVVYANIKLLQKLARMPGRYTELAIKLRPGVDIEKWVSVKKSAARKEGGDLQGWWETEPMIRRVGKVWDSVVVVIAALLFLSTALSVLNIIFMMVAERTVEIGTLMSIGARARDVRLLFSLEAALIGLLGGTLGVLLGNLTVFAMDLAGVPFESPFGAGKLIVHPKVDLPMSLFVFSCAVMICYLSAILPARKAARVEPARAFRGQITP